MTTQLQLINIIIIIIINLLSHMKEEHRLRVLTNRVLGKAVVSKREEMKEDSRELHAYGEISYFQLLTIYYAGEPIKENRMKEACGMYGEEDNCIHEFGRKP